MKHILMVDDSPIANRLHTMVFRRAGYDVHVETAADGVAALTLLRASLDENRPSPDVLLLDLNMPRMDGFEFLEAYEGIAEHLDHTLVIVMVTSSSHEGDMERATSNPYVRAFKNKPLGVADAHEINAMVEENEH